MLGFSFKKSFMTSQIESRLSMTSKIKSLKVDCYTPLYKNEQNESKPSQWRLL